MILFFNSLPLLVFLTKMEELSPSTPFLHNYNKALTECNSTNTKDGIFCGLEVDGVPKIAESSVRINVPARANFKKSNTCGSLFAQCKCTQHSHIIIPRITTTACEREKVQKCDRQRRSQSFSHPDTPVVFTEQNRYPKLSSHSILSENGKQKVEIKYSNHSTSPNTDDNSLATLNIHPEFKVQVIPKTSAQTIPRRRPVLKKGSKSFPSATRSPFRSFDSIGDRTFSSSYSVDEEGEEVESASESITNLNGITKSSTTVVAEINQLETLEKSLNSPKKLENSTAERFFLVSLKLTN